MMETIDLAIFLVFMGGVGTALGLCLIVIRLGAKKSPEAELQAHGEKLRRDRTRLEHAEEELRLRKWAANLHARENLHAWEQAEAEEAKKRAGLEGKEEQSP